MYALNQPLYAASGNIREARILVADGASTASEAVSATASPFIGVSWEASRFPPGSLMDDGFIAIAGEGVMYHGFLQICNVTAGAAVGANDLCTSDAQGRAVTAVATNWVAGIALVAAGAAGEKIRFYVLPPLKI